MFGSVMDAKTMLKTLNAVRSGVPFSDVEQASEKLHSDVGLQVEGHGSIQKIRHAARPKPE
ncbi:hypothetical protein KGY64_00915 [Candidatus Bipolaricaulota bacterium]|nr:hypothetical protein [Candidatus Bipolaricaulota bacterium]